MSNDIGDLEQECEDALFELCDVRERYPAKCASELEQCLHLTRHINMKLRRNVIEELHDISITDNHKILFQDILFNKEKHKSSKQRNRQFEQMLTTIHDLQIVTEQLNNADMCQINCVLKGKSAF